MSGTKSVEMTSLAGDNPDLTCGLPNERYNQWMADAKKRKEAKPYNERRVGWIAPLPNYKVCCCGQSIGDFFFILFLLLVFYGANALFVYIFWSVTSIDLVVTSYIYGIIGFICIITLFVALSIRGKSVENAYLEALADEN